MPILVGSGQASPDWVAWWDRAHGIISDWELATNRRSLSVTEAGALTERIARALLAEQSGGGKESSRLLSELAETGLLIAGTQDVVTVTGVVTTRAMNLLGADNANLFVLDDNGSRLRRANVAGWGALAIPHPIWVGLGEGATGRAYVSGKPVVVQDYARWEGAVSRAATRVGAHMTVPLLVRGQVRGCLGVSYSATDRCTPERLRALQVLAGLAAPLLRTGAGSGQLEAE